MNLHLLQLSPHPFWIPILLAVVQYGLTAGLVTVAIASSLHWVMGGWSSPVDHADFYAYLQANLHESILWLLSVAVLGLIRQKQFDELEDLREEAAQREKQARTLADHSQALRQEIARLEHTVVVSGAGNASLSIELLNDLATAPAHQLEDAFSHALGRLLGARNIQLIMLEHSPSILTGEDDHLSALIQTPDLPPAATPLILHTLSSSGRPLNCTRRQDASKLGGTAAMAALVPGFDKRALGLVLVGKVEPACLSPAGEAALALCCFILGMRISMNRMTASDSTLPRRASGGLAMERYSTKS
ncbi:hypothetical protein [Chelativorans sp. Marseille-P2723]|uniref:hypothetical protein n=1 Tax=Chelativorans sp. Marseille-P2723 TaxID=2709133 RepID=UPI0015705406|nr:hypothetical protein [Chelativorans sp. Marseille-P2723]